MRLFAALSILIALSPGCVARDGAVRAALPAAPPAPARAAAPTVCAMDSASPWIRRWLEAWELTSREILRLPDAPPPEMVLYDSLCVYTTSALTAGGAPIVPGPSLHGVRLPWRALPHRGGLMLPDSATVPIQLMSFTHSAPATGPFFVMAAPDYWARKGQASSNGLTGVFVHEFSHTRQVPGMGSLLGELESRWKFPDEMASGSVQRHFRSDSAYVQAFRAETDLFYHAAQAASTGETRRLAADALALLRRRHARWFVGDSAVFAAIDDAFLSLEGSAQWAAAAWLAHPSGGGLERAAAIETMRGSRRVWSQEEGLGIFLVVDRLLPDWPALVYGDRSMGAIALLERALAARR